METSLPEIESFWRKDREGHRRLWNRQGVFRSLAEGVSLFYVGWSLFVHVLSVIPHYSFCLTISTMSSRLSATSLDEEDVTT